MLRCSQPKDYTSGSPGKGNLSADYPGIFTILGTQLERAESICLFYKDSREHICPSGQVDLQPAGSFPAAFTCLAYKMDWISSPLARIPSCSFPQLNLSGTPQWGMAIFTKFCSG